MKPHQIRALAHKSFISRLVVIFLQSSFTSSTNKLMNHWTQRTNKFRYLRPDVRTCQPKKKVNPPPSQSLPVNDNE